MAEWSRAKAQLETETCHRAMARLHHDVEQSLGRALLYPVGDFPEPPPVHDDASALDRFGRLVEEKRFQYPPSPGDVDVDVHNIITISAEAANEIRRLRGLAHKWFVQMERAKQKLAWARKELKKEQKVHV